MFKLARRRQVVPTLRYRLLEPVGAGLLGRVWQAEDSLTGRPVTVRVLREEFRRDPLLARHVSSQVGGLTQPVLVDGKLTQRLTHPNILQVIHLQPADEDRPPLIVMEPQRGELLADVLAARGRPQAAMVARIGFQLADALDTAHRAGLVHGAPHPGSVLLTPWRQAMLMDFGVMSVFMSCGAGAEFVKPLSRFLAPEHVAGGEPTPASDVYALGALLVTMLTARHPTARTQGPDVPDVLARVCRQTMATDPEARPSAAEVRSALAGFGRHVMSQTGRPDGGSGPNPTIEETGARGGEAIIVLGKGGEAHVSLSLPDPHPSNHSTGPAILSALDMSRTSSQAPSPARRFQELWSRAAITPAGIWHLLGVLGRRSARAAAAAAQGIRVTLPAAARAARRPSRHRAVWYVSAASAVLVTGVFLTGWLGQRQPPAQRVEPPETVAPSRSQASLGSTESIPIPSLVGMTAFDAHERLAEVGLAVASAQPVKGTPGIVISTFPEPGVRVAPGTGVTLFVGAPPGRLQDSG